MTKPRNNDTVTLDKQELAEIIAGAVRAAVHTPSDIEAQEAEEKMIQQTRLQNREMARRRMEDTARERANCAHSRSDGTVCCTLIQDDGEGKQFLICLRCQDVIRPELRPEQFYALFSKLQQQEMSLF